MHLCILVNLFAAELNGGFSLGLWCTSYIYLNNSWSTRALYDSWSTSADPELLSPIVNLAVNREAENSELA